MAAVRVRHNGWGRNPTVAHPTDSAKGKGPRRTGGLRKGSRKLIQPPPPTSSTEGSVLRARALFRHQEDREDVADGDGPTREDREHDRPDTNEGRIDLEVLSEAAAYAGDLPV